MFKKLTIILLPIICFISFTACSNSAGKEDWNSFAHIYFVGMPSGVEKLPQGVQDDIEISFWVTEKTSLDSEHMRIGKKDNYEEYLSLKPGSYEVGSINIYPLGHVKFSVATDIKEFEVLPDQTVEIPIYVSDEQNFENRLSNLEPSQEIQSADAFSRLIQYNGEIYDMKSFADSLPVVDRNETISTDETVYLAADGYSGVFKIMKNISNPGQFVYAVDADCIGLRFLGSSDIVFPKGITTGMEIKDVAHAEQGFLGTPSYFLGSPYLGIGEGDMSLVYLDRSTGDKLTLNIGASDSYISSITYEFEQYE